MSLLLVNKFGHCKNATANQYQKSSFNLWSILKFHHVVKLKNTHNNNILLSKLLDNYLKNTDLKYNKYVKMPKLA